MTYIVGDYTSKFQLIKWEMSAWYVKKTEKAFYISFGKYLVAIYK